MVLITNLRNQSICKLKLSFNFRFKISISEILSQSLYNQSVDGCESRTSLAVKTYNPLLSVDDNIKPDITLMLYPNPVKDVLYFNVENEIDKVVVFDVNGKKLLEKALQGDDKINFQALAKGMYLIQIFTQNKTETVKL